MTVARYQRIFILAFWAWIVAMLALYIGSFGAVIRILISMLML
jgi:hypothetical protein